MPPSASIMAVRAARPGFSGRIEAAPVVKTKRKVTSGDLPGSCTTRICAVAATRQQRASRRAVSLAASARLAAVSVTVVRPFSTRYLRRGFLHVLGRECGVLVVQHDSSSRACAARRRSRRASRRSLSLLSRLSAKLYRRCLRTASSLRGLHRLLLERFHGRPESGRARNRGRPPSSRAR